MNRTDYYALCDIVQMLVADHAHNLFETLLSITSRPPLSL